MSDALFEGRRIRLLTIVDCHTRESLAIEARFGFKGGQVVEVLSRLVAERGAPKTIRCDNGPEFVSRFLDHGPTGTKWSSTSAGLESLRIMP